RERLLQGSVQGAADGVRGRSAEAPRRELGGKRRVNPSKGAESRAILEISNLQAGVDGKTILHGIDLVVREGEVHAIMGPNGSGKSTLAQVLAGRESLAVSGGEVRYLGRDLLAMTPEERSR